MMYGSETRVVNVERLREQIRWFEWPEIKMLQWMCGVSLKEGRW